MNNNPFSLAGKTILVTGASSGIGRETAIQCSQAGARLVITGRDKQRLTETLLLLEGTYHKMFLADLTDSSRVDNIIQSLDDVDGVVHAVGISKRVPVKFIKEDKFEDMLHTNFFSSSMFSIKLYKAKKIKKEASLVFISSVAANYATVGSIMYMSSKGALNSFVKGFANELAHLGIRANAILPGMIETKMNNSLSDIDIQKDLMNYPLGRYGKPKEVAWAAVYLLSDATKWMTGSLLTLDGGLTLR